MYNLIAEHYSEIFPLDAERVIFIDAYFSQFDKGQIKILDVGCATGDLSIALGKLGYDVVGIDLNQKMISIANKKKKDIQIEFKTTNMMEITPLGKFHGILCFGNTLPHLSSLMQVKEFFLKCYTNLHSEGVLIIQILNYDRILKQNEFQFPVIEHNGFHFKRKYTEISEKQITFTISMQTEGRKKEDHSQLLPIKQRDMKDLLKEVGFEDLKIYQGYDKRSSDLSEFATLYLAKK